VNARNPRFALLDSLRAIAALSVFGYHVVFHTRSLGSTFGPWLRHLNVGVPIFFLISGFLLYRPWARARFRGEPGPSVRRYAARRALRIVPAYWLALPLVALWLGRDYVFSPGGIVTYFGFLQAYRYGTIIGGIGQAWTLSVEMSFYIALPLLALTVRRVAVRSSRGFLVSELALCGLLFAFAVTWQLEAVRHLGNDNGLLFPALVSLPGALDLFALGMVLAVVSVWAEGTGARPLAVRVVDRASWLPWVGAAAAYVALVHSAEWFGGALGRQVLLTHELGGLVAFGLLLPAVFGDERRGVVRRLLGAPMLRWVGRVSYAFYLWHLVVILKLQEYGVRDALGRWLFAGVCLAVSLAIAAASWYWIERRFLDLGRRRPPARTADDAAVEPDAPPPASVAVPAEAGR